MIAPDDYRHDLLEIKLWGAKGQELACESLYEGEEDAEDGDSPSVGAQTDEDEQHSNESPNTV